MTIKTVKGTETDKWLPREWRKSTFPILSQPAKTSDDIIGSAFLVQYKEIPYIITAKHVIDTENPVIAMAKTDRKNIAFSTYSFNEIGLKWVHHSVLDLAAMPFFIPVNILKELDTKIITEDTWNFPITLRTHDHIAHLGYPMKEFSIYSDGSPSIFPQGMPGEIIKINEPYFIMHTAGTHGASGGPVFRKESTTPSLVGVVIEAKMYGKPTCLSEAVYLEETIALPITPIKDILDSSTMNKQLDRSQ